MNQDLLHQVFSYSWSNVDDLLECFEVEANEEVIHRTQLEIENLYHSLTGKELLEP